MKKRQSRLSRGIAERGSMLLELLIAMVVLATGLCGLLTVLISAVYTNTRSGNETASTMVAEHVMEQVAAQQANSGSPLSVADCAGNTWSINTAGAASGTGTAGAYGGNGAQLTAAGTIDWAQNYDSVPQNYGMKFISCGSAGRQNIIDVRWNIVTLSSTSRMIVVSARPFTQANVGGLRYVVPVNLVTTGGMP